MRINAMAVYNIHEAKTQLSKLIALAEQGDEVVIARDGLPIVRLSALSVALPRPRVFGQFNGMMSDTEIDALFSPEAEAEILDMFEESALKPILPPRSIRSPAAAE
jgi:antitoxin (DNA-binding transcriptional repressor) of toxin-antitoxin stability system